MRTIDIAEGTVGIEATVIAHDLGLEAAGVLEALRKGQLTAVFEQGLEEDAGRFRLTFYHQDRRLRLVVDESGRVLERSTAPRHSARRRARSLPSHPGVP